MNNIFHLKAKSYADEILKYLDLMDDILWEEYGRLEIGFNQDVLKLLPFKSDREEFSNFLWNKFYSAKTYNFTSHTFDYNGHNLHLISEISDETSEVTAYVNIKTNQDELLTIAKLT